MSQTERILARLKYGSMCSLEPLDWEPRITRTAARIQDLKDQGNEITASPCIHSVKTSAHVVYELADENQGRLFA
jgi:hypothetical protein